MGEKRNLKTLITKAKADKVKRDVELVFRICCLPEWTCEYRFDKIRRWRFDWAWADRKVYIEYEGWGRHQRWTGYSADCDKYNEAALQGWRGLRFTAWHFKNAILPKTIELLKKMFEVKI